MAKLNDTRLPTFEILARSSKVPGLLPALQKPKEASTSQNELENYNTNKHTQLAQTD